MRRQLAALAALTVIVLGTPAIALASTITAGSGPLAQVRLVCPPRALTFDLAPGSSTLTEVFGPVPAPPEEFRYHGQTYTIMTVNPGAGGFTVFRGGMLFVNHGPAITRATVFMICTPRLVR
jgi:hypothetical protein